MVSCRVASDACVVGLDDKLRNVAGRKRRERRQLVSARVDCLVFVRYGCYLKRGLNRGQLAWIADCVLNRKCELLVLLDRRWRNLVDLDGVRRVERLARVPAAHAVDDASRVVDHVEFRWEDNAHAIVDPDRSLRAHCHRVQLWDSIHTEVVNRSDRSNCADALHGGYGHAFLEFIDLIVNTAWLDVRLKIDVLRRCIGWVSEACQLKDDRGWQLALIYWVKKLDVYFVRDEVSFDNCGCNGAVST